MQNHLPHGGVVAISGGPASALSREEIIDMVTPSDSYPDELELGLGLSLGSGKATTKTPAAAGGVSWDQYATFLTAKDFPGKASSSSSSSVVNSGPCGSKRAAESPASPPGRSAISQVVGWPPVRTYRANTLANQSKSSATDNFFSAVDKHQTKNTVVDKANEKGPGKTCLFVKVNMDGIPIGRKVDLNAHTCYDSLALTLGNMFTPVGPRRSNMEKVVSLQLLAASSDFVLTYEDREGDWMLVGDVPWAMFLNSVRRLRIMRTADANGLAPESNERSWNPSTAPT